VKLDEEIIIEKLKLERMRKIEASKLSTTI